MEQDPPEKWEGKAAAKLLSTNADEAWSLLSDFCSLHLWLPGLVETCRKTAGDESRPGCVRYCGSPPGDDGNPLIWAYEELLAFDPAERSFRYKVADNNIGLKRYVATFKVVLPPPVQLQGGREQHGAPAVSREVEGPAAAGRRAWGRRVRARVVVPLRPTAGLDQRWLRRHGGASVGSRANE